MSQKGKGSKYVERGPLWSEAVAADAPSHRNVPIGGLFVLAVDFVTAVSFDFRFTLGSSSTSLGGDGNVSSNSGSAADFLERFFARPSSFGEVRFGGLEGSTGFAGFERGGPWAGPAPGAIAGELGAPASCFALKI